MSRLPVLLLSALALAVPDARAAEDSSTQPFSIPDVTVTATRVPTPTAEVASSITVITADDIQRKQQRSLPDVLREVPGLTVNQTGGPGGLTSVFIRGTNSNHVKVFVDGIDVADPSSPNNSFDFGKLLTFDLERVEVLRGPQSGLYGSDAIGGVINIVTKRGEGPPKAQGVLEGGSFGTFNQYANVSGGTDTGLSYSFNAGHFRSEGTPVTPLSLLPPGRKRLDDDYDNRTLSGRVGAKPTDNFDLEFVGRYIDTTLRTTGTDFSTFPAFPAAAQSESSNQQYFTRGQGHLAMLDGRLDHVVGLAYTSHQRSDKAPDTAFGPSVPALNKGDRLRLDYQGNFKITPDHTFTFGAEHYTDRITNSPLSRDATIDAGFLSLQSGFFERFYNTISVRHDEHDTFGGKTTFREAPAYLLRETGTKLKASVGTGFKAPTLNQLFVSFPAFNFFANPNLKPEQSIGYDVGFEQQLLGGDLAFGAVYFHNDIDNLITTNATTYVNVAKAKTWGAETFAAWQPLENLALRLDYTYTRSEDAAIEADLLRRPKHKLTGTVQWRPVTDLSLSASATYLGSRVDGNRDFSVPRLYAAGYTIVNLAGEYAVTDHASVFARVDNAGDYRYEDPVGFQRPTIGAFGGIRAKF